MSSAAASASGAKRIVSAKPAAPDRPDVTRAGRRRGATLERGAESSAARYALKPEVPTQPVSDTSTMTPSGPLYLTSTLPWRS